MKYPHVTILLCLFAACLYAAPPTPGQYLFQKKTNTGPFQEQGITPENGKAFGIDLSGNPAMLSVGGGGGSGDVNGPASSVNNRVAVFDGTTGKTIKDSGVLVGELLTDDWTGSASISTLGTVTTGVWQGTAIADAYIAGAALWNTALQPGVIGVSIQPYNANTTTLGNTTTGTGAIVRATSPALVTPSLGVATATSINGLTIGASTGALSIADGKTLTIANSITLNGTDSAALNIGNGSTLSVYAALNAEGVPKVVVHSSGTTPSLVALSQFVMTSESYENPSWLSSLAWGKLTGAPDFGDLALLDSVNNANWSGTDLSMANGGTGASLTDPNADRVLWWDDSSGSLTFDTLLNLSTEASPAAGDFLIMADAAGVLRKVNWSSLPSGGGGGVTSVAMTVPTGLSVAGTPITSTGTLAVTWTEGYQGYTSVEATKLSGIETGADVTDAANVAGAGAVMTTGSYESPAWLTSLSWSKLTNIPTTVYNLGEIGFQNGAVLKCVGDELFNWQMLTPADIGVDAATAGELNYVAGASSNIQTQINAKAGKVADVNYQTGTTYTLQLSDIGKLVVLTNAATVTVTLPDQGTTAWTANAQIGLIQGGAGKIVISSGGSSTVNGSSSKESIGTVGSAVFLLRTASNIWLGTGVAE